MNCTRRTIRKHLNPWIVVGWVTLFGLAWCADQQGLTTPTPYQQEQGR